MIVGIANIYLYTALTATASDSFEAKTWMDQSGVSYTHLHYHDINQVQDVLSAISTWFPSQLPLLDFPFVTYEERYNNFTSNVKLLRDKQSILASNLAELSLLS